MEKRISMNQKEISRISVLEKLTNRQLKIIQAAEYLNISTRQVKRLVKAFKEKGPIGIISKKVGAPSNHQAPQQLKDSALKLILEKYQDFGPTLAQEYLKESEGINLSISTSSL